MTTVFQKGGTMIIKNSCLVCNRAVIKTHKAVQRDRCVRYVYSACNYQIVYIYRKLRQEKSRWYCLCCLKKEMPFCSLKNGHGKIISAPHKKVIMNARHKTKEND